MPDTTTIILESVICVHTSEPGKDEVFLRYRADDGRDTRYPPSGYQSMDDDSVWETKLYLTFKEKVEVHLYDNDTGRDELLGSASYTPTSKQPDSVPVYNTAIGSEYRLDTRLDQASG